MKELTTDLVARASRLDGTPDLLTYFRPDDGFFFEHPSRALVTVGSAQTISVPGGPDLVGRAARAVGDVLSRVHYEGPPPVVIGALPFDDATPATLVLPCVALIRARGETWRIDIGPARELEAVDVPTLPRGSLRVTSVPDPNAYVASVAEARARIRAGALEKAVLARMLIAQSEHEFDRRALLARLRAAEPSAFTFAAGGFIGASPELLVSRTGDVVRARPLAGTIARRSDAGEDEAARVGLLASHKDRAEHALVVDAVSQALAPVCTKLDVEAEPHTLSTSKVWHLATDIVGDLRGEIDALSLVSLLHPTPAVCGTPREAARQTIKELEQIERALYAGAVGWVDARGDGEWAVALRCAEMQGRIALLFAGAGIVAESDPEAELAETDAKFRSMLEALGYA